MCRILCLIAVMLASIPMALGRESGTGREFALIGTETFVVHTYRPQPCPRPRLLLVFAGTNRDADRYRDRARKIADRACLWIVSPLLDKNRFPSWKYQNAGVTRRGQVQPATEWTGPLVANLVAWARSWAGQPAMPYSLFGHSAGAQFLGRVVAFAPPPGAERIVLANPSAYVWPSVTEFAPYGFGGVFDDVKREASLRAYLAQPITIFLGQDDTGDHLLVKDEPAMRQGANRYERGLAVFRAAKEMAQKRSWRFNWKLVEVPDTGHSAGRMLSAPEATLALEMRELEPAR